jgi:inorganic pyrophosphatase
MTSSESQFKIEEHGLKDTNEYRVFFKTLDDVYVSPFHDIPLIPNDQEPKVFNMIVEIPRWTNAKMEIDKQEIFNPIKQDTKKGKLRFVDNCFPYHGYIWNYGAFPQTWEKPLFKHPGLELFKGDNDPLDVIEIGSRVHPTGSVIKVKVLGALALIDDGELDWKIISIDISDPLAEKLNDLSDLKMYTPGLLKATLDWFRIYKIPAGSEPNKFGFNEDYQNRKTAEDVIHLMHLEWRDLFNTELTNDSQTFSLYNTQLQEQQYYLSKQDAQELVTNFKQNLVSNAQICDFNPKYHFVQRKEVKKLKESKQESFKLKKNESKSVIKQLFDLSNYILPIIISILAGIVYLMIFKQ